MSNYVEWYQPGSPLMRCIRCGSLVGGADTDLHDLWHEEVDPPKTGSVCGCGHPADSHKWQRHNFRFGCAHALCDCRVLYTKDGT